MSSFTIDCLFAIAFVLPLVGVVLSLATRRFSWNNTLVQSMFILSGFAGLIAGGYFFTLLGIGNSASFNATFFGLVNIALNSMQVFFLMLVYGGVLLTSLYAIQSLPPYKDVYVLPTLNIASAFFIVGMQATILSPSLFTFLMAWEIMSVSAYFLVIADRSDESLRAGWLYFVMTHIGFACIAAGLLLLAGGNLFASWHDVALSALGATPLAISVAFVLLFAGFGSKAGLVPLHQWLPYAHPQAPSGSSALLSGVMLKVALFGFIQGVALFPFVSSFSAFLVISIGLLSAFFGALRAAVENDAKRVLAWSSIENMGLIFSAVGIYLLVHGSPDSAVSAIAPSIALFIILHTANHFIFKTGLFMAVGAVASKTHTRNLDELGGLAQRWPIFAGIFLALSLAAAALPPFGTFFGEWTYFQTLASGMTISAFFGGSFALILALLALVGGLALFAYVRMFSAIFLGRARTTHAEQVSPMPILLWLPPLFSVLLSIIAGLFLFPILSAPNTFMEGVTLFGDVAILGGVSMNAWWVLLSVISIGVLLTVFRRSFSNRNPARITDTWDCGQPITPRMQYTATGFSAPIRFFFKSILMSEKELIIEPISTSNPWIVRRRLVWSIESFFEYWLYRPIGIAVFAVSHAVKKLQNGVIQLYLLLVICALVFTLATTL